MQRSLGLKNEDVYIIEGLINNDWTINHLIDSDFELDYWKLREFLVDEEWQKADEQTRTIMLKIADREGENNLDKESIKNFPDKDLYSIDRLWVEYSKRHFGFSIQKKIFETLNQDKGNFADRVGWREEASWFKGFFGYKSYSELTFSLDAPEGHLPVWGVRDKKFLGDDLILIFSKFSVLVSDTADPLKAAQKRRYKKAFIQKVEQEGFTLSVDSCNQLEYLRQSLELLVEQDFKDIEKPIIKHFYQKNLQQYVQELLQKIQQGHIVNHDTCNELSVLRQSLDLRNEDVEIVEKLIKNNWTIDHLISSDSEVDYWKLREFLADEEWQKADEQTRAIMLKIAGREGKNNLDKKSVENFPGKDLFTIDRLWVEYSKGHFGFSVQKKIFETLNQDKGNFAERVGWRGKAGLLRGVLSWKSYKQLTFNLDAPEGHLPVWGVKDKKFLGDDFVHFKVWNLKNSDSESKQSSHNKNVEFSKLSESEIYAFYGGLFAMAAADGSIDPEEVEWIQESIAERHLSASVKNHLIQYQVKPPSLEDCLNGLSLLSKEIRWEFMFNLIQVSLADNILDPGEEQTLKLAQSYFNVSDKQIQVMQSFVKTMIEIGDGKVEDSQIKEVTNNAILALKAEGIYIPQAFMSDDLESNQIYYSEEALWIKIGKFANKAGTTVIEKVLILFYTAQQSNVPIAIKASIFGALGYFILPFDLVSDFIPLVGWTDDLGALATVLTLAAAYITPEVNEQAQQKLSDWFGKQDEKKIEQFDVETS